MKDTYKSLYEGYARELSLKIDSYKYSNVWLTKACLNDSYREYEYASREESYKVTVAKAMIVMEVYRRYYTGRYRPTEVVFKYLHGRKPTFKLREELHEELLALLS